MDIHKLVILAKFYLLAAESEELPANSKDEDTILKNLSKLETFRARTDYSEANLKHISSGSSRVIYKLTDKLALKLAKNEKGMAQNKAEANPKIKTKYINKPVKSDDDGVWVVAPLVDKITEKEFEELSGINFKDFAEAISYGLRKVADNNSEKKPKKFDAISKNEMYKEIVETGKKCDMMPGDLERISSWAIKDNHPIISDAGLTSEIYKIYYDDTKSKSSISTT